MPTARQKRVAKLIIENATIDKPNTAGQMLEKVGYSPHLVKQPGRVLESEGVKEALNDYGFNEDNAKKVVSEILLDSEVEPHARLKAADQVFKVQGSYAPEKHQTTNVNVEVDKDTIALAMHYEEELKKGL